MGATLLLLAVPASAGAVADEEGNGAPAARAESAAAPGALPFTYAPISEGHRATASAASFYDNARQRTLSEAGAEVRLFAPVSLHGGASTGLANGPVAPFVGGRFVALKESRHWVDGVVSATYRSEGFNLVPELQMQGAFGRHFGASALYLNLAYGHGLERGERHADVGFSAIHGLFEHRLFFGIDSRVRIDAERDDDEPAHEGEMDAMVGPVVGLAFGAVALSGFGGLSATRYRDLSPDRVGAFGGIRIGTVFF
jgi:hypothetical protein